MSFRSTQKNWEGLAQKDALWAICTHKDKRSGKWDEAAFFQTGEVEIAAVFSLLEKEGIPLPHRERALDFGCGVGRLSRALAQRFSHVIGIDVSPTMVQKAQDIHVSSPNLEFRLNTEKDLGLLKSETISFIYSSIVLQHIPYPASLTYLQEFLRLLVPGGILVFQLPTKDIRTLSLVQRIKSFIKIRERLALIGIGDGFHMEMNPIPEEEIRTKIESHRSSILRHYFTNHTDPDFNGNIHFMAREESIDFESSMFIVQKHP